MEEGTVKWFNANRGYGWIVMEDGTNLYFHASGIRPTHGIRDESRFLEGVRVRFTVVTGGRGPKASRVEVIQ